MKEANQEPLKMSYDNLRKYALSIETAQEDNNSTSSSGVAKDASGEGRSSKANNIPRTNRNRKSKRSILEGQ
jgi:hypothetical protein